MPRLARLHCDGHPNVGELVYSQQFSDGTWLYSARSFLKQFIVLP
jgi:hypothetical protein